MTASGERGAVSILVIALAVVACSLAVAVGRLGHAAINRAQAETAADAAALAAADAIALGRSSVDARAAASRLARANGARLISARISGRFAQIAVEVADRSKESPRPVRASSRAEVGVNCLNCRPRS